MEWTFQANYIFNSTKSTLERFFFSFKPVLYFVQSLYGSSFIISFIQVCPCRRHPDMKNTVIYLHCELIHSGRLLGIKSTYWAEKATS